MNEYTGVTGGTLLQEGPFSSDEYYVFIQDELGDFCFQDFRGSVNCLPSDTTSQNSCNFSVTTRPDCIDQFQTQFI